MSWKVLKFSHWLFSLFSLVFTVIWSAISTIYQVINLQKSRDCSPQTTLPQSFIGQYTLTVEAFVKFAICAIVHPTKSPLSLNYFSCVAVVGFTRYIYFSKWLGWCKVHNDIDFPPFAILLELLVISHSSSERRSIFVPWWLKLFRVLVVLQLAYP